MSPPGGLQSLKHRVRRMHPAGPLMRRSLSRMDRASAADIRRFQERRLRLLVRLVAARSPFYQRWFAGSGVDPSSIRGLDDLVRLPLISRADIMAAPTDFAVYPPRLMWPSRSSGTSGQPLTVYRTPGSSAYELATLQRQWSWFGLPRAARRVVLRGSDFTADPTRHVHQGDRRQPPTDGVQLPPHRGDAAGDPAYDPRVRTARRGGLALQHRAARRAHPRRGTTPPGLRCDHLIGDDEPWAARADAVGVRRPDRGSLRADRASGHGRELRGRQLSRLPRLRHPRAGRRRRAGQPQRDRRHRAAQLGLPGAALPDRRRGRPDPRRTVPLRPGLSSSRHGRRPRPRTPSSPPTGGPSRCRARSSTIWTACSRRRSRSSPGGASRSAWCPAPVSTRRPSERGRCATSTGSSGRAST